MQVLTMFLPFVSQNGWGISPTLFFCLPSFRFLSFPTVVFLDDPAHVFLILPPLYMSRTEHDLWLTSYYLGPFLLSNSQTNFIELNMKIYHFFVNKI
jgi:hypothetical protein